MTQYIARLEENKELNGIEIYFMVYPLVGTRDTMKEYGYRWNYKKSCWYAKNTEERMNIAKIICETTVDEYKEIAENVGETVTDVKVKTDNKKSDKPKAKAKEKKNKYGVKVGDIFSMSWGYEQTNNNFFQVVALAGESSVRVVEVVPKRIATDAVSPMSADYTYDVRQCAVKDSSMWINDQEKGDLKRLKCYNADGTRPQFYVTSYADAYYVSGDTIKVYDSWYY